jgi:co-chaperonin GroES (HSP10)
MRRTTFRVCVTVVLVAGGLAAAAVAQETKSARGTVTAVGSNSISVKAGERELTFAVDGKTVLIASGAGTASRQAAATGKPGPKLSEFIKSGDAVEVNYVESGGAMRASEIRRVASPGAGGGATSDSRAETANGTVESIAKNTLTITGSGGGGSSFKQSFTVDDKTKVIAVGAGTASEMKGKISFTDFVGVGDQVTVTYSTMGSMVHADEVRVRSKKK